MTIDGEEGELNGTTGPEDEEIASPDGRENDDPPPDDEGAESDELIVEIEGFDDADELEQDTPDDTPVIQQLRDRLRNKSRQLFERDRQLAQASTAAAPAEIVVGDKPTLESCEWDEDKFEGELIAWQKRRDDATNRQGQQQAAELAARQRFDSARQTYLGHAARIAKPEAFQAAEATVGSALPPAVGNAIPVYFGDRGPALVLALNKRPDLLEKVSKKAETDLVGALFDLWDMSKGVKMVTAPKKKTFEREDTGRGSAPIRQVGADKRLEELEKEADRTNDRSKVVAYKAEKRKKAA